MTPSTAAASSSKATQDTLHSRRETLIHTHTHFSSGFTHTGPQRMKEEEVVVRPVTIATVLLVCFYARSFWTERGRGPSNTLWTDPRVLAVNFETTKPKHGGKYLTERERCGEQTHPGRRGRKEPPGNWFFQEGNDRGNVTQPKKNTELDVFTFFWRKSAETAAETWKRKTRETIWLDFKNIKVS